MIFGTDIRGKIKAYLRLLGYHIISEAKSLKGVPAYIGEYEDGTRKVKASPAYEEDDGCWCYHIFLYF